MSIVANAPAMAGVKSSMERWQFIRWGIAASVLVHVVIAAVIFLSTDVRRFEPPTAEEVAVDIVDPDPPLTTPEAAPSPSPSPELTLPKPDVSSAPSSAPASSAAAPQPAPSQSPVPPAARDEGPQQPKAAAQAQPQPPAPAPMPQAGPSYVPAEPDLTVKYGVMLGLPPPLSPLPDADTGPKEGDAPAGSSASSNLAANLTGAFREHLKRCSKLPGSVSRSDNIMVKLRVVMTPNGRLAAEPDVIEVTNPIKAVALKQAAVNALTACQPYAMLPPDRYKEWKVLELSFTPQDFLN